MKGRDHAERAENHKPPSEWDEAVREAAQGHGELLRVLGTLGAWEEPG